MAIIDEVLYLTYENGTNIVRKHTYIFVISQESQTWRQREAFILYPTRGVSLF
jgi:hypothetical protein